MKAIGDLLKRCLNLSLNDSIEIGVISFIWGKTKLHWLIYYIYKLEILNSVLLLYSDSLICNVIFLYFKSSIEEVSIL